VERRNLSCHLHTGYNIKFNISRYILYLQHLLKKSFFFWEIIYKKSPSANAKGLEIDKLPRQDDFRNFCMSHKTEKVYHELEEVINT